MHEQPTQLEADAPELPDPVDVAPAHLAARGARRRRWVLPVVLAPVVLFLLAVIAWAVDTSSGGVARNVSVAGEDVSGLSESALRTRLDALARDFEDTPVELVAGEHRYRTVARDIGLLLDVDRTARAVLDVDGDTFVLVRPLAWMRSFFDERHADVHFRVSGDQVARATVALEGDDRVAPTEPALELVDGVFTAVPGVPGRGIDPEEVAARLPEAASAVPFGETVEVVVEPEPIPPQLPDEAAEEAAARAESLFAEPIQIRTPAGERTLDVDQLRSWVRLETDEGTARLVLDPELVAPALRSAFADIEGAPVDARFTVDGGRPVIIPDQPGLVCCADDAPTRILEALEDGVTSVALDLVEGRAAFTTADAEAYGIVEPVGGNHAWRDGQPTTAGPGFTTYHAPGGARVTNIHRIADLVRGAVIPPGGTFSVNGYVGRRTAEKGFVPAGAIRNGQHVDEIGGGISQFATTLFNAAYFAGLDIPEYQAHSEYFSRYPYGREATMGYPSPDLKITNNTPYGVLIWTSYTDSSLTVTLYSTTYATAEQTGITESMSGACKVVTTTRTRTYPDGRTEQDTFRARYRPGEGQFC